MENCHERSISATIRDVLSIVLLRIAMIQAETTAVAPMINKRTFLRESDVRYAAAAANVAFLSSDS